ASRALGYTDVLGLASEGTRWAWAIAADAALTVGDLERVQELVDLLGRYPQGHVPAILHAEEARIRAHLLAAAGNDASEAFADATAQFRRLGSPYHLACCLLDEAEYLARQSDQGAVGRAEVAATLAGRLGVAPLTRRAETLTAGVTRNTPAPTTTPAMTT
ncbi:MAG: hypothetical protein QOK15_2693, partial [Nocardioidaceae bacterium]|nr:hypothetical protein [Nocardioidaceae bacterium]